MIRPLPFVLVIITLLLLSACDQPHPTQPQSADAPFIHPGILHNRSELDFVRTKVAAREEPWFSAWQTLQQSPRAKLSWIPQPRPYIFRGAYNSPDIGATEWKNDAIAAYTQALEYIITGQSAYAEKAIQILNAYANTFKDFEGHDNKLAIGESAFHFLNAAELIRYTYPHWLPEDQKKFEDLVRNRWYPIIKDPVPNNNGNWDAAIIQTKLAMGIFLNDRAIFNEAIAYATTGQTNGNIPHYFMPSGECQESGRDQGHTQMGLGFLGCACEVAWKQGIDLYALENNRLAVAYEYTAKYNLGNDVPYVPYRSIDGHYNYLTISPKARGNFSPIYEKVYRHYHDQLGLDMPFTRQVLEKIRPEKENPTHVPWGTLTFADVPPLPKGFNPDK